MMWGDNCSNDAEKATKIATGIQVRVWCDSDWKDDRDDEWGGSGVVDDKQTTLAPTLAPTIDEWKNDGHNGGDKGWGKDGWDDPTGSPSESLDSARCFCCDFVTEYSPFLYPFHLYIHPHTNSLSLSCCILLYDVSLG